MDKQNTYQPSREELLKLMHEQLKAYYRLKAKSHLVELEPPAPPKSQNH